MANTVWGSGILFGCGSTLGTIGGLGALTLTQSEEHSNEADEEIVRDSSGNTKSITKYDHRQKATLEFVSTSSSNSPDLTISTIPSAGVTLALTDAMFVPMGATWIVDAVNCTRANTKALQARISLSRYIQNSLPA